MAHQDMGIIGTINRMRDVHNIKCSTESMPFKDWATLPKAMRGVYILSDADGRVIYVGKGFIRTRQSSHWPKAHGTPKKSQIYPKAWQQLQEAHRPDPSTWTLHYISLNLETELSAMEGSLIHALQPIANDETYKDNH